MSKTRLRQKFVSRSGHTKIRQRVAQRARQRRQSAGRYLAPYAWRADE